MFFPLHFLSLLGGGGGGGGGGLFLFFEVVFSSSSFVSPSKDEFNITTVKRL